jgi:eukaryotic-like serine/threonine-protein kinase
MKGGVARGPRQFASTSHAMTAPVQEGDILDGKYRIDKILGIGGMGVVVAATHTGLDRRVAIKFLLPAALEHPEIVERFDREARAAATVKGQHVVQVIDVGRLPDGRAFMVMEYLDGKDLEQTLEVKGKLTVTDTVGYVLQACEALAEAHHAGIVHRDLKPANLFLAQQPDKRAIVKVLDFGISKVKDDGRALTRTATAMGTPFYMSPEQLMNSKDVDARSDIWALGVIMYELLSGTRPYSGESMPEIVAKILGNKRELLRELNAEVSPALEDVIAKCLQTERENRFASVGELARALSKFASASAQASVGRIARVLGDASLAPPSPAHAAAAPLVSGPPTAVGFDVMKVDMPAEPLVPRALDVNAAGPVVASTQMSVASTRPPAVAPAPRSALPIVLGGVALLAIGSTAALWATRQTSVTPDPHPSNQLAQPPTAATTAGTASVKPTAEPALSLVAVPTTTASTPPSVPGTKPRTSPTHQPVIVKSAAPTVQTAEPQPTGIKVKIK